MLFIGTAEQCSRALIACEHLPLAMEIAACTLAGVGLICAMIFCRPDREKAEKMEFLSVSVNEEALVHNALITCYEQQRDELIARQQ